jgi:hypothetical protein
LATIFVQAGYGVVIEDIVLPPDLPSYILWAERQDAPVHLVALVPDIKIILARECEYPTEWGRAGQERIREIHRKIAAMNEVTSISPASRTANEVADRVVEIATSGLARL